MAKFKIPAEDFSIAPKRSNSTGKQAQYEDDDMQPLPTRSKHVQLLMYPELHAAAVRAARKKRKSLNRYIEELILNDLGEDIETYL